MKTHLTESCVSSIPSLLYSFLFLFPFFPSSSPFVCSSSQAKLKLPLLRRDKDTRLLSVNFDKDLDKLLREVK